MYLAKNSRSLKGKKKFRKTFSEARIDNASIYEYGFLEGTEERREEFLEQFTKLNFTCFVRSKTSVKGKDIEISKESGFPKTSGQGTTD